MSTIDNELRSGILGTIEGTPGVTTEQLLGTFGSYPAIDVQGALDDLAARSRIVTRRDGRHFPKR